MAMRLSTSFIKLDLPFSGECPLPGLHISQTTPEEALCIIQCVLLSPEEIGDDPDQQYHHTLLLSDYSQGLSRLFVAAWTAPI